MGLLFSELDKITGGKIIHLQDNPEVTHLLIDSRKLVAYQGALFIAIKGPHHNGHDFIPEVFDKGIRQFVITDTSFISDEILQASNVLLVTSAIGALQKISSYHRKQFDLNVIGITGSNGKTIVKEWLGQILGAVTRVVKSPKSYNSQVGVPLSVWQITEWDEVGIFEAGISRPGEMFHLEKVIRPDIGLFTNLGTAHDEGFPSRSAKLQEKLKLFVNCRKIIYCADHSDISGALRRLKKKDDGITLISWSGTGKKADYHYQLTEDGIKCNDRIFPFALHDRASTENIMHCLTVCKELELTDDQIINELAKIRVVPMRLELKRGVNGSFLIDDTYNNDLNSLEMGLDFVNQQGGSRKKAIILSDILQAGQPASELYRKVAELIQPGGIDLMIGVGSKISENRHHFKMDAQFFDTTEDLLENLDVSALRERVILVKGARMYRFERIVRLLEEKVHGTRLEVNLNALTNNLNYYRSIIKPGVRIMAMVKALAYGGGSVEIATLLQFHKVDYLAVAYPDEGIELRNKGIFLPIMVMNAPPNSLIHLAENDLQPEVYSPQQLTELERFKSDIGSIRIHLKLESGMNRLGFDVNNLDWAINFLKKNNWIEVVSVFSHLAVAEDPDEDEFSLRQCEDFEELSQQVLTELPATPMRHLLNSAGISRFPGYQFEMVRLGIGLYGIGNDENVQSRLQPVSTLKTSVSQVRKIKKGESVGYGRAFVASRPSEIATIALGYADGFDRRFGNGVGRVIIRGRLVPVVGNVCMDMTMVDVTGLGAEEGDEVVVFGDGLSVKQLAEAIGTIPYELLTNVGGRVKRVFFSE